VYTADESSMISVLIVDDHPLALDALRGYLQTAEDIEIVSCTGDGTEAVALVQEHVPDVVQKLHLSDRTQARFWALQHRSEEEAEATG